MADKETNAFREILTAVNIANRQLDLISQNLVPVLTRINQVVREHEPVLRKIGRVLLDVALWNKCSELLKSAGWLPHRTMPYRAIGELGGDTERTTELVLRYYRENWQDIREYLESELSNCDINKESMATFVEALDAHENGLYRGVCRVLLPEIERLVRVELESNKIGTLRVNEILVDFVDDSDMSFGDMMLGDMYNVDLFKRFVSHVYEHVDAANRQDFADDPVPNRHAAVHGLVIYSTEQNSLNTIFMADYIFRLVAVVKSASTSETDGEK